uniref:CUE domain-containing protein n=1 Tax=Romanomermis culicivorax TaxID=13658 RepID=A0A915IFW7_ROMCU
MIILRMATRKEAEICQNMDHYAKLIYDNYLLDVPRIIDTCSLYGEDNERLVRKMVESVFKCQPKYYDDLREIFNEFHKFFAMVHPLFFYESCFLEKKFSEKGKNVGMEKMGKGKCMEKTNFGAFQKTLDKCIQNIDTTVGKTFQILNQHNDHGSFYNDKLASDTIHFLIDFVYSTNIFLKIFPQASKVLHETGLTERLPSLFEKTYPALFEAIANRKVVVFNANCQYPLERLAYYEESIVKLYRTLICYNILDPLLNTAGQKECIYKSKDEYVHDFISFMMHLVHEKSFALAYSRSFPFGKDLKLLHEKGVEMDHMSMKFISDALEAHSAIDCTVVKSQVQKESIKKTGRIEGDVQDHDSSLIRQIRDIFPGVDISVIRKCLKDYNNNVERIVNDMLTGALNVETYNDTTAASSKGEQPGTSGINSTKNGTLSLADIADDFERVVPLEHSKKRGNRNVLADKSSIQNSKPVYERYAYEKESDSDEDMNDPNKRAIAKSLMPSRKNFPTPVETEDFMPKEFGKKSSNFKIVNPNRGVIVQSDDDDEHGEDVYDDEYDDTYDSHEINVGEANTVDEIESKFKRANLHKNDTENDKAEDNGKNPRVQATQKPSKPWEGEYTGGKERQFKERHKGRSGNHNRKAGSLYKHSRGMGFF